MSLSHVDGKVIPPKPQPAPLPTPDVAMLLAESRSRISRQHYLDAKRIKK